MISIRQKKTNKQTNKIDEPTHAEKLNGDSNDQINIIRTCITIKKTIENKMRTQNIAIEPFEIQCTLHLVH